MAMSFGMRAFFTSRRDQMRFEEYEGKTVFITGAASGIGQTQAIAFLDNGANVFALDVNRQGLELITKQYKERFNYVIGNVADKKVVKEAVDKALTTYSAIDVLLNTAGILDGYAKTLDTDETL